ncbi:MAG: hypothetical protein ISS16_04240 [Ignavibacteria bacterium]|nr:hypothetical protein [Ignavibacteria bacterium]
MYDSKHRFFEISTKLNEKNKFMQKGLREYLLCNDCEQQIGRYEKYVNDVFFNKTTNNVIQDDKIIVIKKVDYVLMKLFQLSILWRASISSKEIFRYIELGPHQEIIRKMIYNEKPGKYYEYGCLQIAVIIDDSKLIEGLMLNPEYLRIEGYRLYRFVFGGFIWAYFVSSHNYQYKWKKFFLLENGTLTIHKEKFDDLAFLTNFGIDMKKQGKL